MIRKPTQGDREAFLALCRDFYHSDAVLHSVPDEHFARTFDAVLEGSPWAGLYLLESDGQLAGYAVVAITWSNEAGGKVIWLEELSIAPAFQGKGLGREFFAFAEGEFPDAARFRLEAAKNNTRAIRLYERLGYREFDYYQMIKDM